VWEGIVTERKKKGANWRSTRGLVFGVMRLDTGRGKNGDGALVQIGSRRVFALRKARKWGHRPFLGVMLGKKRGVLVEKETRQNFLRYGRKGEVHPFKV